MSNHRLHQICTDAAKAASQAYMGALGLGSTGFTVALSADGTSPATHWGQSLAPITDPVKAQVEGDTAGGTYPTDSWWWCVVSTRLPSQQLLESSNNGGTVGQAFSFDDALAIMGLVRVGP